MDLDRFVVETLDDLEARATWDASEYNLLRMSALLRELLVDGRSSLVVQANRTRRLRLRYHVRTAPASAGLVAWLGIDPEEAAEGGPVKSLTLDELLAVGMVFAPSMTFSVRDLITYGSNVLGGVHIGDPSDAHQGLRDHPLKIEHAGRPLGLVAMVPLAHVVLAGVRPLREVIRAGLQPIRPFDGRVSVSLRS
jgi:hypothetical protein